MVGESVHLKRGFAMPALSRRAVVGFAGAGLAALALPAAAFASARKLKVSVIGAGHYDGPFEKRIFPFFTAETGIEVESVVRPDHAPWIDHLARAARLDDTPADVSMISRATVKRGMETQLFAPIDLSLLPNCDHVRPGYFDRYPGGRIAGVATVTWHGYDVSGSWVIARASRMKLEAHAFINFMCKPEIQVSLSRGRGWSLDTGPHTTLPSRVR
jgi:spermidine/putrescine-binding protein